MALSEASRLALEGLKPPQRRAAVSLPRTAPVVPRRELGSFGSFTSSTPITAAPIAGVSDAPSLAQQGAQMIGALPAGLFAFGKQLVTDPVSVVTDTGKSIADTGRRVGELGVALVPGGMSVGETEYGRAVKEGRILATVVEDLGNVALVGAGVGAAGRVAGAAARRLPTAGARSLRGTLAGLDDLVKQSRAGTVPPVLDGVPTQVLAEQLRRQAIRDSSRLSRVSQNIQRGATRFDDVLAAPFLAPVRAVSGAMRPVLGAGPTRRALANPFPSATGARVGGRFVEGAGSRAAKAVLGPDAAGSLTGRLMERLPVARRVTGSNLASAIAEGRAFPRTLGRAAREANILRGPSRTIQAALQGARSRLQAMARGRAAISSSDTAFQKQVIEPHLGRKLKANETIPDTVRVDTAVTMGLHAELDRALTPYLENRRVLAKLADEPGAPVGFVLDEGGRLRVPTDQADAVFRRIGDDVPVSGVARRETTMALNQVVDRITADIDVTGAVSQPMSEIVDELIDSEQTLRRLAAENEGFRQALIDQAEAARPEVELFASEAAIRRDFAEAGIVPRETLDQLPPVDDLVNVVLPEGLTMERFVERMAEIRNRTAAPDVLDRFDRAARGMEVWNSVQEQGITGRRLREGVYERPLGSRETAGFEDVGSGRRRPLATEQAANRARQSRETTQTMFRELSGDELSLARERVAQARAANEAAAPPLAGPVRQIRVLGADGVPTVKTVDTSLEAVSHWTALRANTPASSRPVVSVGRQGKSYFVDLAEQAGFDTAAGQFLQGLANDFPDDLARLVAREIEPHYVRGGQIGAPKLTEEAFGGTRGGRAMTGAEQARLTSNLDLTIEGQVRLHVRDVVARTHNEAIQGMIDRFGRDTGQLIDELGGNVDDFVDADGRWVPQKVQAFFEENGFKYSDTDELVWRTDKDGRQRLRYAHDRAAQEVIADGQAVWLPDVMMDAHNRWYADLQTSPLMGQFDDVQQKWKKWTLALTPRWQVNNLVGNALQAVVTGGVNPADIPRLLRLVDDMIDSGTLPGELIGSSLPDEVRQQALQIEQALRFGAGVEGFDPSDLPDIMSGNIGTSAVAPDQARTRVGRRVDQVAQSSYRLNEYIDQLSKGMVYLDQVAKGADPVDAIDFSLRSIGDFQNLTPWERRTVRRVFPFYTWMKHITAAATRLPFEHPSRVAAIFAVGQVYAPEADELAQYRSWPMFGNIPGPLPGAGLPVLGSILPREGEVLRTASFDPFGSATQIASDWQGGDLLTSARQLALGSASPFIRLGAGLGGLNITQGGNVHTDQEVSPSDRFRRFGMQMVELTPHGRYLSNTLRTTNDPLPGLSELYQASGLRRNQDVTFDSFGRPRMERRMSPLLGRSVEVPVEDINRMRRGRSDLLGILGIPRPFTNAASR